MENELLFTDRAKFREWLMENHSISNGIWLVFGKTANSKTVKPEEALEEALCFGWIDGQIKSIDDTKYIKKFTPRRKGSKWSEKNRALATTLIAQRKMTDPGFAAIEQAKKDGAWDIPKAEPISDEQITILTELLKDFEPAFSNFQKMSRSVRATYTALYLDAKQEETKKRRLTQIVSRLNENKKPM
ncbi:MAG TPA: YdeI/OmpD-associated family protein [Bacillota bacterium]|nr:YdeI/OmpD-associated family protein [Bacillota bacterium]